MNGHIASLTTARMHLGLVRRVGEENGTIAIADVTEPDLVSWIKESIGEGQPIEIVPELADPPVGWPGEPPLPALDCSLLCPW
jgi:hypothetical protein